MALYPNVPAKEWAERYGLTIEKKKCKKCGKMFLCNIPFAIKGYRGLQTKDHGCGKHYIASIATPVGEKKEFWERVAGAIA